MHSRTATQKHNIATVRKTQYRNGSQRRGSSERAHAHPDLTLFRARQLQLLHGRDYTSVDQEIEASECTMIRDLRNITMGYLAAPVDLLALLPDAALRAEAVIALVAEGEELGREQGRSVRPRRE